MTESEGYRIVQQLGTGLAGPVFLAESASGRVAIRRFQPLSQDGTEQAGLERLRFLQTGHDAAKLKLARIANCLEVVDEGDDFLRRSGIRSA